MTSRTTRSNGALTGGLLFLLAAALIAAATGLDEPGWPLWRMTSLGLGLVLALVSAFVLIRSLTRRRSVSDDADGPGEGDDPSTGAGRDDDGVPGG